MQEKALSILIPTYNYDCTSLVQSLVVQSPSNVEIIVGDDGSTDETIRQKNSQIASLPQCTYFELSHNSGRAVIKNRLAEQAQGKYLLFVDNDAQVDKPDFLHTYLQYVDLQEVVCGGVGNMPQCPSPAQKLRYAYEVRAEKKLTLERRRENPYAQFSAFNFMIRKELFMSIKFKESFVKYGYEDTAFGFELMKREVPILHIDNKLIHLGIDNAEDYLRKIETSLDCLHELPQEIKDKVRISSFTRQLDSWHVLFLIRGFHHVFGKLTKKNLLGPHPIISLLNVYKLGYYATHIPSLSSE